MTTPPALGLDRQAINVAEISVVQGDITELRVDVIVNAANERLLGGGGVDGAIHQAAGNDLFKACTAIPEQSPGVRCPTGQSRVTPGFLLPAKYVIHTVGPIWQGGTAGEEHLLRSCYTSALTLANEHEVDSIAFPSISCGVYGYPPERAASIAVRAVQDFHKSHALPSRVILVGYSPINASVLRRAVSAAAAG